MAGKDQKPNIEPQANQEIADLAARLFMQHWQPGDTTLGKNQTAFACMCFQGAKTFLSVAARVREGQTPDEIISQLP